MGPTSKPNLAQNMENFKIIFFDLKNNKSVKITYNHLWNMVFPMALI